MQAPWWWSKTETRRSDIFVYFNVNFNVFFKLIKVHLLVSELYIVRNDRLLIMGRVLFNSSILRDREYVMYFVHSLHPCFALY